MKDKLLLWVIIVILPDISISSGAETNCPSIAPGSGKYCVTKGQKNIPSDLPASITILNMENNYVKELTSDSFKRYRFLKELNLEGNRIESISADAFSGLNYLTKLNLRANYRLESVTNLPASLEFLDISRCDRFTYNNSGYLTNLKSLKQLNLQDARLTEMPKLDDVGSSLKTLDIQYNENLSRIRVADLAPLCKLENLYVTISNMSGGLCDCLAVQLWIRQYDIKGSNITCGKNEKTAMCERPVDLKEYENMRRNCNLSWTWKTYWIYGAGFLAILLGIICCFFVCRRMKCNQISVLDEEET